MINVLMCGSVLSVKGGMVSVVKNYLNYKDWEDVDIRYILLILMQINMFWYYILCGHILRYYVWL